MKRNSSSLTNRASLILSCIAAMLQFESASIHSLAQDKPKQPPSVNIFSPEEGAAFVAPSYIRIFAEATDTDGKVKTVEFFAGTKSLGVVTNDSTLVNSMGLLDLTATATTLPPLPQPFVPFRFTWTNVPSGPHALTAVATDDQGLAAVSAAVHIQVSQPEIQTVVTIVATDPVATEPDPGSTNMDTALFTVFRTGRMDMPVEVRYRLSGTASNRVDYRELGGTVTMPAGANSAGIVVSPINDEFVEGTKTVVITLETPPCADLFPLPLGCYLVGRQNEARAEIRDNDKNATNRSPVVSFVRPFDGQAFVTPANVTLAAMAQDLDGAVLSVEFFAGEHSLGVVTNKSNPVSANSHKPSDKGNNKNDNRDSDKPIEGKIDESHVFQLTWTNVPPGDYVLSAQAKDNLGATTRSQPVDVKVVERKEAPVVTIIATDAEASESAMTNGKPNTATFTVYRTGDTNLPLTVHYRLNGKASHRSDYRELPGMVTIRAGSKAADIIVDPIDDNLVEGTEIVIATLMPPLSIPTFPLPEKSYRVGEINQARISILDNDVSPTKPQTGETNILPVITVSATDGYASEGNGANKPNPATFKFQRSGNKDAELKVYYSVSGTASNGVDYVKLPGVVAIPAGERSANVSLTPIDDKLVEGTETVIVKLELPPANSSVSTLAGSYAIAERAKAAAIINDNDTPRAANVRLPDGLFHLWMPGLKGLNFRIEASSDLVNWVVVDHDTEADGEIHFVDTDSHNHSQRYYRIVPGTSNDD
jgi:hypothetical protein